MGNLFNLEAPIWVFMGEVADVLILAALWWVCSLGIVTVGASTSALYYVIGKKVRKESSDVISDFFKSFKENIKQSIPFGIMLIIGSISFILYSAYTLEGFMVEKYSGYLKYLIPVLIVFSFEFFNIMAFTLALLARFEMKSMQIIKTAIIILHRHLITSFCNIVVIIVVGYGILKAPIVLVLAPALIVFGQSFLIQKCFTGYIEAAKMQQQ